jgi:hypothetical protein
MNTHAQSEQPQRTMRLDQFIFRAMLHYNALSVGLDSLGAGEYPSSLGSRFNICTDPVCCPLLDTTHQSSA